MSRLLILTIFLHIKTSMGAVMEVTDPDGRKGILSGRVVPGPWVRVDGGKGDGYDCKCNMQSQCQCATKQAKKYPTPASVMEKTSFEGPVFTYGVAAKFKKKYLLQHLGTFHASLKPRIENAADQLSEWPTSLLKETNHALHTAQRDRKIKSGLPLLDCSPCEPSASLRRLVGEENCKTCEDNGIGGCGCAGFCCCEDCPC
eukprot:TRINITY_DN29302_c0_g1_i1.p1 TRINITY_DN29302_c0_g1~~TRINITY_DN29302_c0_g1_i1.p1  ORF type:complete len:201 (+),score=28.47 TRINITY_DN29302_c0_g1_i1:72-674(+)